MNIHQLNVEFFRNSSSLLLLYFYQNNNFKVVHILKMLLAEIFYILRNFSEIDLEL